MRTDSAGVNPRFWRGRRVFLTGHTGFKGGWLAAWLIEMGAEVLGYALPPDTKPSFFELCGLKRRIRSVLGDIRDTSRLARAMRSFRPETIFHLAAQPLVRRSYRKPLETFAVNVLGTLHVLEAARQVPRARAVVVVTSDKCYENPGGRRPFREIDPLGGSDPYSASKACAELVTIAYQKAFFVESKIGVATVRAGNVIGGGDWAKDRIVPDAVRAFSRSRTLEVRNPNAVRPWQHVLDPLGGYLALAERLHGGVAEWSGAWNFGPSDRSAVTVGELVERLGKLWDGGSSWRAKAQPRAPREATELRLDSSKARRLLGWRPRWELAAALRMTADWYQKALRNPAGLYDLTRWQIRQHGGLRDS